MSKDIFSDLKGTTTEQMRQKSIEMERLKFTLYNLFSFIDVFLKKRCFYTFCVFLPNIEQVNFFCPIYIVIIHIYMHPWYWVTVLTNKGFYKMPDLACVDLAITIESINLFKCIINRLLIYRQQIYSTDKWFLYGK